MFGDQVASMVGQLTAAGMTQQQANILAQAIGQCQATLTHRGSVSLLGPVTIGGPIRGRKRKPLMNETDGALIFGGEEPSYYLDGSNIVGTPGFRRGTLDSALTRDGTANVSLVGGGTLEGVLGYFIKSGWQAPSGARVGVLQDVDTEEYIAIVLDDCLEVAA